MHMLSALLHSTHAPLQGTARRHREPYLTLAQYRRTQGKVLFGSLFSLADELSSGGAPDRETTDLDMHRLGVIESGAAIRATQIDDT